MKNFVPKDKMSKKAQKVMNREQRKTWGFSPVTRTVPSIKAYNRAKEKAATCNKMSHFED